MLPFIRLVQSEMPFLATGKIMPVQVEGVSLLWLGFAAELVMEVGKIDVCASGLGSMARRWLLHSAR